MGIEFDTRAFKRDLKKDMEAAANKDMRDGAQALQREVDAVARTHSGQSIEVVTPALRAACQRAKFTLSDAELSEFAEAISKGNRIEIKPERVNL